MESQQLIFERFPILRKLVIVAQSSDIPIEKRLCHRLAGLKIFTDHGYIH